MHLIDNYNNVAELSFNNFFLLSTVLFLQIELFLSTCYNNYIFFINFLKKTKVLKTNHISSKNTANKVFFLFFFFVLIFHKSQQNEYLFLIFFSSVLSLILNNSLNFFNCYSKKTTNFNILILSLFIGFLFILIKINSFLTLFFFIELYGVLYYFSFLSTYSFSNQTILKYKNGLLLLLWNNFLTTFFISFSCYLLLKNFGTTNFLEISMITQKTHFIYLFILGLCWKLGLPLFHFFKLEIYKFLLKENVFLFSILTTLFNLVIIYFCFIQSIIFTTIYMDNLLIVLIIFALNIILLNLNLYNILYFFAISSVLTMTTIFVVFLI